MAFSNGGEGAGDIERRLAAGADRDVSEVLAELRAHTQVLNALRETQLEQGRQLAGLDGRVAGLAGQMIGPDQRMSDEFAMVNTGMGHITGLLENLARGEDGPRRMGETRSNRGVAIPVPRRGGRESPHGR